MNNVDFTVNLRFEVFTLGKANIKVVVDPKNEDTVSDKKVIVKNPLEVIKIAMEAVNNASRNGEEINEKLDGQDNV